MADLLKFFFTYALMALCIKESDTAVKFLKTMTNYTAIEGGMVVLRCQFENGAGLKRSWTNSTTVVYAGSAKYSYDKRMSLDVNSGNEYSIKLLQVTAFDEGRYTCTIYDNPIQTKTVYLKVNVPARITSQSSREVTLDEGGKTVLVCVATGKPRPNITWRHIVPSADGIMGTGSRLPLYKISRNGGGIYECTADNQIAAPVTQSIRVKVRYRPEMMYRKEKKEVFQAVGGQTVLECTAFAYPVPKFTWIHYDTVYDSDHKSSRVQVLDVSRVNTVTSKLSIGRVALNDFGEYKCIAKNVMGSVNGTVVLRRRKLRATRPPPIVIFNDGIKNRRKSPGDGSSAMSIRISTKLPVIIISLVGACIAHMH